MTATVRSNGETDLIESESRLLATLFGDDIKKLYRANAGLGTRAWRANARLTMRIIAANHNKPESERLPKMLIWKNAADQAGCKDGAIRNYVRLENRFGALIEEHAEDMTVTIEHLRRVEREARLTKTDPVEMFKKWIEDIPDFGILEPPAHFDARIRNGNDQDVDPVVRSLTSANRSTATALNHLARKILDAKGKRREMLIIFQRRIKAVADRIEVLREEAERNP